MSIPYAMIARPIPMDLRRRVWVKGFGYGVELDRITLGDQVTGIGVHLDSGMTVTASPSHVHEAGAPDTTNVVQLNLRVDKRRLVILGDH